MANPLAELLETERAYVSHLEALVTHYVLPFRASFPAQCTAVFANVETIRDLHKLQVGQLEAAGGDATAVAAVFARNAAFFKVPLGRVGVGGAS